MVANCTCLDPIENGDLGSKVNVTVPSKVGSRPHSEVKVEFGGISAKNNYDAGV